MCLILVALDAHPEHPLIVAANRDEYHARPSLPAHWWGFPPTILAGRDLRADGTWLGVRRDGRWGAVTNVREPGGPSSGECSRGSLVVDGLRSAHPPERSLAGHDDAKERYGPFNLLVGDGEAVWWRSNRAGSAPKRLEPGVHGLSNCLLDTPWPKVAGGREIGRAHV